MLIRTGRSIELNPSSVLACPTVRRPGSRRTSRSLIASSFKRIFILFLLKQVDVSIFLLESDAIALTREMVVS